MAMSDYILCEKCGNKALYDGEWRIRDREDIEVSVLCGVCAKRWALDVRERKPLPKEVPGE